jgi:hypothetical protein
MRRGSVQGSRGDMAAPGVWSRRLRRFLGTPGRRQLALFAAVYLLYDCGRWAFAGQPGPARARAHWVIHVKRPLHMSVEREVQRALGCGLSGSLLSNLYLAAQLVVLPGALIRLYRRDLPAPSHHRGRDVAHLHGDLRALPALGVIPQPA